MKQRFLNCGLCGVHYHTYSTHYEMAKEQLEISPETKNDKTVEICDDCFKIYKNWLDNMTEEERIKISEG